MNYQNLSSEQAAYWLRQREWANGLVINPHPSVNTLRFAIQYITNTICWNKAFAFLNNPDLAGLMAGKYEIMGERVFASVSVFNSKEKAETRWEAHKKYIDIQYIIQGEEIMGMAPLSAAVKTISFDPDKDLGFYEIPERFCQYHAANQDGFFIFFPDDAHRPCIRSSGKESEKKVVIKIEVVPEK